MVLHYKQPCMRLLLSTLIFIGFTISCFGQSPINKKMSFKAFETSVEDAIIDLSIQSEINIAFNNSILPSDKIISVNLRDTHFKTVLKTILDETNVSFKLVSNQIILFRENTRLLSSINIKGFIEDRTTGERLVGANIYNPNNAYGTDSNEYGYFSFNGVPDIDSIYISYLGYETEKLLLSQESSQELIIKLNPSYIETVVVTASDDAEDFLRRPSSGVDRLDLGKIKKVVGIGGEADIFQSAYQLNGIKTGADGVGGLHVRGGNLDQNLILLDGAPVYRPEHAIGVLSIFNSDAISSAKIYKGNFPAKYGSRLSSVLDVQTNEGNNQEFEGKLSVGLLAAKATLQGPIVKDVASFFVSYRRSLTDIYLPKITRTVAERDGIDGFSNYLFDDLNVKTNFRIGKKDRFYFTYYSGKDDFINEKQQPDFQIVSGTSDGTVLNGTISDSNTDSLRWGNQLASFRWNHLFGDKIFTNTTAYLSRYSFDSFEIFRSEGVFDNGLEDLIFEESAFTSDVNDIGIRTDAEYLYSDRLNFKFGGGLISHTLKPGSFRNGTTLEDVNIPQLALDSVDLDIEELLNIQSLDSFDGFAYIETGISLSRQLYLTLGLHGRLWEYDGFQDISILPRVNFDYSYNDKLSFSASYLKIAQHLHLLTKSDIGLPGDLWVPSSENVLPETAVHYTLGMKWNMPEDIKLTIEAYHKDFDNLVEFLEGDSTNIINAINYESKVTQGTGTSRGIEFGLIKKGEQFTGSINYTYSKTDRQFDEINGGEPFPYRFDLRHVASAGFVYAFNKKWTANATWIYSSGINLTLPSRKYNVPSPDPDLPPISIPILSARNDDSLPANHRLDIGMNYKVKKRGLTHNLQFGIYNAYNSLNPIFFRLRRNPQNTSELQFVSVSLLPITPSFNYSIEF